ncbi:transcriptional regulator domain-containing protein [Shinella sp.]|uniref:transcriptional regulator domain-containing protein n=1 Tax=Shinella sp. TaxID=1870904 RepID=UPI0039E28365
MSNAPDWNSLQFIEFIFCFDRSGFAFEFLRRNIEYQKDYSEFVNYQNSSATSKVAFSDKWGLVFPG